MDVSFEFIAPDGAILGEADVTGSGERLVPLLNELEPHYGRLIIFDPAQDDETHVTDDLEAMMRELCLRLAPQIASGASVEYQLAAHPEVVRFTARGDRTGIDGDSTSELWCEARPLAQALVAAGERYAALKEAQIGEDAASYLRSLLDKARAGVAWGNGGACSAPRLGDGGGSA
jgi:hypothetical protein